MKTGKNTKAETIGELSKPYLDIRLASHRIRARIEEREKQIERLNKKLEKLPFWKDGLIKPIAEELIKHFPDRRYEILGPFGLTAETAIHFYRIGVDDKKLFDGDNCISITFRPGDLEKGELNIVNHKENTGKFAEGTLGEVNGMNNPTIPLSPDMTIEELLKLVGR